MALRYDSLTPATRSFMRQELAHGRMYDSSPLTGDKSELWLDLLYRAATEHNDTWLAREIVRCGLIALPGKRAFPNALAYGVAVMEIADDLAQTAFNHLYLRALCLRARWEHVEFLEVYCGKSPGSDEGTTQIEHIRIAVPALMWALFSLPPRRLDQILGGNDESPRNLTARFLN